MVLNYTVATNDINIRLSNILKNKLHISNRLLIKLKNGKCIFVNDKICNVDYIVNENDKIQVKLDNIYNNNIKTFNYPLHNFKLDILFEDEYLLIVNKPAFMPVHPCSNNIDKTLLNAIYNYYNDRKYINCTAHIITRLDSNTSGICFIAKNSYIQELFITLKDKINFKKSYIALVNNIIKVNHNFIINNISRDENSIITRKVTNDINIGKYAKTEYTVTRRNYNLNYTEVIVTLHTGRTHQIRVHFASLGHTLLGDELYANIYDKSYSKECKRYINRHALHCSLISFIHPITNELIDITCNVPKDFNID